MTGFTPTLGITTLTIGTDLITMIIITNSSLNSIAESL